MKCIITTCSSGCCSYSTFCIHIKTQQQLNICELMVFRFACKQPASILHCWLTQKPIFQWHHGSRLKSGRPGGFLHMMMWYRYVCYCMMMVASTTGALGSRAAGTALQLSFLSKRKTWTEKLVTCPALQLLLQIPVQCFFCMIHQSIMHVIWNSRTPLVLFFVFLAKTLCCVLFVFGVCMMVSVSIIILLISSSINWDNSHQVLFWPCMFLFHFGSKGILLMCLKKEGILNWNQVVARPKRPVVILSCSCMFWRCLSRDAMPTWCNHLSMI